MTDDTVTIFIVAKDEATKAFAKTAKNLNAISDKMMGAGKAMTMGVTAPLVAAGGLALKAASDYEQAMGAVDTVFEEAGNAIKEYSQTSATAVGLSAAQFSQLSAVSGAFLQNVGFNAAQAADETIKLTERASDMAATFNTDVTTALEAIQSGLKGEFNPLEQFGVKMNMAAIDAQALAMGLASTKDEIDDTARAQAALSLIYDQTNKLQGTFQREAGGVAGSMEILKAQFTDIAQQLGKHLIPIAQELLGHLSNLVKWFSGLSESQQKTIVYLGMFVAAMGPVLMVTSKLISVFTTLAPIISAVGTVLSGTLIPAAGAAVPALGAIVAAALPVIAVIGVVGAAIAALYYVWTNNINGIQENTASIFANIRDIFSKLPEYLADGIRNGIQTVVDAATELANGVKEAIEGALGISSRSKVMAGIGTNLNLSLASGINQSMGVPVAAMAGTAASTAAVATYGDVNINMPGNVNNRLDMREMALQIAEEFNQ